MTSVGISNRLAVGDGDGWAHYRVFGRPYLDDGEEAIERMASVGYFETLRTRLLRGRYFTEADDASKHPVDIINQAMAKRSFPEKIRSESASSANTTKTILMKSSASWMISRKDHWMMCSRVRQSTPRSTRARSEGFFVTLRSSQSEEAMLHPMVNAIHRIGAGLIADEEDTMTG